MLTSGELRKQLLSSLEYSQIVQLAKRVHTLYTRYIYNLILLIPFHTLSNLRQHFLKSSNVTPNHQTSIWSKVSPTAIVRLSLRQCGRIFSVILKLLTVVLTLGMGRGRGGGGGAQFQNMEKENMW